MISEWKEIVAQDGRKYYHNVMSKETTWEKPDALKSAEELQCDWTEYLNKEGKPYYYNSKTKKSQWEKPKEYIEMMEKRSKSKPEQEGSNLLKLGDLFQANNLKLPGSITAMNPLGIPITPVVPLTPTNPLLEIDQKLRELEEKRKLSAIEIEKLSKEDIEKLFKDMLRRAGVSSTWKWEDAQRVLQNEEVWKAVKTFSQKRSLFNEYIKDCKNMEREEIRLKREKLKLKFRQMLEEDNSLTSDTKFAKIFMKFCHDERWRAIDEREREELFQDYLDDLEKRENEERKIIKEAKIKTFRNFLQQRGLTTSIKWKDILINFKDDPLFNSMEKIDRLRTFTQYITELEAKEKEEKYNSKRFMEFMNRENFREFLHEKLEKREINIETKWRDFVYKIKDTAEYLNLIGQDGSQPKDLFDDVIFALKDSYKKNKEILKKILKLNQIKFAHDTTFEQFEDKLKTYEEYTSIDSEMKTTLYSHLIKKLKDKEKHNVKVEKKLVKKLESYFIKGKFDIETEEGSVGIETKDFNANNFQLVLCKVREHSRFNQLSEEKIKEIYEKMKVVIKENDELNKRSDDTSSESGQITKRKPKRKKENRKKTDESIKISKIPTSSNVNSKIPVGINKNQPEEYTNINQIEEKEDGEASD